MSADFLRFSQDLTHIGRRDIIENGGMIGIKNLKRTPLRASRDFSIQSGPLGLIKKNN